MKQEEFLLDLVYKKNDKIKELEDILKKDSDLIRSLLQKIENLESINKNNKRYLEFAEQKLEYETKRLKNKRFGIGLVSGYGYDPQLKQNAFIGIGLSYNLIRF